MHDGHRRIGHFPSQAAVLVDSQGQWRSQGLVWTHNARRPNGWLAPEKVATIQGRIWCPAVSFVSSWHSAKASAWSCRISGDEERQLTLMLNYCSRTSILSSPDWWAITILLYFSRSKEPASPALQLQSHDVATGSRSHQQQAQPAPRTRIGQPESSIERAHPQPVRQYRAGQNVPSSTFTTRTTEESQSRCLFWSDTCLGSSFLHWIKL